MKLFEAIYLDIIKIYSVYSAHSAYFPYCDQMSFEKFMVDARFTDDGVLKYTNAIEIFQATAKKEKLGLINRTSFLRVLLLLIKKL